MNIDYTEYIGRQVRKTRKNQEPKPFKSGYKINTVKRIINHPILNIPAFTFEEDDSYVECRRCFMVNQYYEGIIIKKKI